MLSSILLLMPLAQCQPAVHDLMAGQHFDVGDVTITNTGDALRIDVELAGGAVHHHQAMLYAVHIYAGLGPPPGAANCGNPPPGQFPYKTDYPAGTMSHTEVIPFSDLGIQCGDTVQVAVHAEVSCASHPDETAWASGQNPFCGSRWGWWIDYDTCCTASVGGPQLGVSPLVAGSAATFSVTGALPHETLSLYRSFRPAVMGAGHWQPSYGATVLDVQSPIALVGTMTADSAGAATLSLTIPATAPVGRWLTLQAVALRQPDAAKSGAVYARID